MVRVTWAGDAIAEIESIRLYIAQFNPRAGDETASRLIEAGNSLATFPARGRPAGLGCRELTSVRPYRIRYEILPTGVRILRVRHAARLPIDQ